LGLRSSLPIGAEGEWAFAASWAERMLESDLVLETPDSRYLAGWRRPQKAAFLGTSVQGPAGSLDQVGLHASYAARADSRLDGGSGLSLWSTKTDDSALGLFVIEGVGRGWTVQGGIRATHGKVEDKHQLRNAVAFAEGTDRRSFVGQRVSWGLEKRLRRLSLAGSLDTTLGLRSLISYVDFSFEL
jgi:hypothetical protein